MSEIETFYGSQKTSINSASKINKHAYIVEQNSSQAFNFVLICCRNPHVNKILVNINWLNCISFIEVLILLLNIQSNNSLRLWFAKYKIHINRNLLMK